MLTLSVANIRERLGRMPMFVVTLALIAGIVTANIWSIEWFVWLLLLALSAVLALFRHRIVVVTLFALGAMLYQLNSYQILPHSMPLKMVVKITDDVVDYGRFGTCAARVLQCEGSHCRARVKITTDSLLRPERGDIIELNGYIRPFTPQQSSYAQAMHRQGFSGRVTVSGGRVVKYIPAPRSTLHNWAVERIESLLPQSEGRDVAISLSLGAKAIRSAELKQSYSYSGMSHLLAVSGLHVGMVVLLLNLLLLPLSLVWRGNIARSGIVVVLIWCYVALCGYPTSAIRAAVMFSVLQLSHMARSRYAVENSLATTAFVMLAAEPTMLFELSFQLSFVAVMAIVFVGKPLMAAIGRGEGMVGEIISGVVISTVCVVATAPLISYSFGIVSWLSIIVTPFALITAQIIIISTFVALLSPLPIANIAAQVAQWCGTVQNRFVAWSVESGIGYTELRIDFMTLMAVYGLMALLLALMLGIKYRAPRH